MKKQPNYKDIDFAELQQKLNDSARKLGTKLTYTVLLLFFAYREEETPGWAKNIVIGAIGYLILPMDLLPDVTPWLGLTDDIGILSFALTNIATHITMAVKINARKQMKSWFGKIDLKELQAVEERLN